MRSLASMVRYGGRLILHFKILSMVFFLFSAVNGGWWRITGVSSYSKDSAVRDRNPSQQQ